MASSIFGGNKRGIIDKHVKLIAMVSIEQHPRRNRRDFLSQILRYGGTAAIALGGISATLDSLSSSFMVVPSTVNTQLPLPSADQFREDNLRQTTDNAKIITLADQHRYDLIPAIAEEPERPARQSRIDTYLNTLKQRSQLKKKLDLENLDRVMLELYSAGIGVVARVAGLVLQDTRTPFQSVVTHTSSTPNS